MSLCMEAWEQDLLDKTKEFVDRVCPNVPADQRVHVIARVYEKMRQTLKLFRHT